MFQHEYNHFSPKKIYRKYIFEHNIKADTQLTHCGQVWHMRQYVIIGSGKVVLPSM